jgi:hypothetical protein
MGEKLCFRRSCCLATVGRLVIYSGRVGLGQCCLCWKNHAILRTLMSLIVLLQTIQDTAQEEDSWLWEWLRTQFEISGVVARLTIQSAGLQSCPLNIFTSAGLHRALVDVDINF